MQRPTQRRIRKWVTIILIVYVGLGIAFYFLQEKILFHPKKLPAGHAFNFPIPFHEVNLPVNNEKNLNIIQFTVPDSLRKGIVLYFHGNMRNVERYAPFAPNFTRNHYEVWIADYPGYGKTTGKRTEQIMYEDAKIVYQMARARVAKDSIIIYGRSLGTGIAAYLASVKDCKRLILEAPYYSMESLIGHYAFIYPVGWMSKYHFPSYKYIQNVDAPVTIFHGTKDEVIPFSQSRRLLKKAKKGAELIPVQKARHNSVNEFPLYHQKLDSLLQLP